MIWGYQNGWFPEFLEAGLSKLWGKLHFLQRYGFKDTTVDIEELLELAPEERDRVAAYLSEHDLHIQPSVWYDYVNSDDRVAQDAHEALVEGLAALVQPMRSTVVFTKAGCGHRFDGSLPVDEKLSRLSSRLAPLATACKSLGAPLAINNQGDFYIGDFCELADRTDELYLWIDTANIFWAGEPIFPAFERAAERTLATHWRDEKVVPGNKKPRGVLLENCVTGHGDVNLPRCYQTLLERAPDPDNLVMEIELFPPRGMDKTQALHEAIVFCREQTGGEM